MKSSSSSTLGSSFSVEKLKISNDRVTVEKTRGGKPSVYEDVNMTARNISYDSPIPFTVEARTPGGGKLKLAGTAGPINQPTPRALRSKLRSRSTTWTWPAPASSIHPASGIAGVVDYTGTVKSNGRTAHSEGKAKVAKLRVVPAGSPAQQPVSLNYASDYDLKRESGVLTRGDIQTGGSTVRLSGDYDLHGPTAMVHMKLNDSQLPVRTWKGCCRRWVSAYPRVHPCKAAPSPPTCLWTAPWTAGSPPGQYCCRTRA